MRRLAAAALALALVLALLGGVGAAAEKGYYRVVVLADPHLPYKAFKQADDKKLAQLTAAKDRLVEDINAWPDVDEVVVVGDVTGDVGSAAEYAYAAGYFARFAKPVRPVTGNHDYIYADEPGPDGRYVKGDAASRRAKLERFKAAFGLPELYYTQTVGDYLLVFLAVDSLDSPHLAQMSDGQVAWLRAELRKRPAAPTIIFYHAPLKGTLTDYNATVNTPSFVAQPEQALAEIIAANPQIVLWVSGHTHTPATREDFAAAVNVYGGRVTNIHNADVDRRGIWTNSLYLYPDRVAVRTFDHRRGIWLEGLERVFPLMR